MTTFRTLLAAAVAFASIGAAQAEDLRPTEGRSIDLGKLSGVAYYTVERDGFRVAPPSLRARVFRAAFGYSSLTQTLLYAAAVAVIAPGLLVFGPLSDVIGRRALILAGLISFGVGDVLFVVADGTAWLFAARLAQGPHRLRSEV
jgi:MFS family permease